MSVKTDRYKIKKMAELYSITHYTLHFTLERSLVLSQMYEVYAFINHYHMSERLFANIDTHIGQFE